MGQPEAPFDRRYVGLFFEGAVEEVVEQERERWKALVEEGLVVDWERREPDEEETGGVELGEREEALAARQSDIETRISAMILEEFDDLPDPVDTYPEESEFAIGFWGIPHTMFHQLNYNLEDELDMYVYGMEHTLRNYGKSRRKPRASALG